MLGSYQWPCQWTITAMSIASLNKLGVMQEECSCTLRGAVAGFGSHHQQADSVLPVRHAHVTIKSDCPILGSKQLRKARASILDASVGHDAQHIDQDQG